MNAKLVVLTAAVLAFGVAAPGIAAKGKPKGFQGELRSLGISCPARSVELQGSFGGAGDGFLALVVSKATGKAASLKGKQVSLRLLRTTTVVRHGPTTVSKLTAKDHLRAVALMCSQGLVARTITAT